MRSLIRVTPYNRDILTPKLSVSFAMLIREFGANTPRGRPQRNALTLGSYSCIALEVVEPGITM